MWGATDYNCHIITSSAISIHAPRVGRDVDEVIMVASFLISIHAPRVGRDSLAAAEQICSRDFNPRAPCGARRQCREIIAIDDRFQSTRPVWGATLAIFFTALLDKISIHAPRVGRDTRRPPRSATAADFNPRAPCGARPDAQGCVCAAVRNFNPRAPCGARPGGRAGGAGYSAISIHAPRVGRDLHPLRM